MFTIYYSDVTGLPSNCNYPHKKEVIDNMTPTTKNIITFFVS